MSRQTCILCKHFDMLETQIDELGTEGRCRRYPPQLDSNYDKYQSPDDDHEWQLDSAWYVFPIVVGTLDWCGELKK